MFKNITFLQFMREISKPFHGNRDKLSMNQFVHCYQNLNAVLLFAYLFWNLKINLLLLLSPLKNGYLLPGWMFFYFIFRVVIFVHCIQSESIVVHQQYIHTVSFDWFLSGLEGILNVGFCLSKVLIFYQKILWNITSRLNSSTFWVFEPVFDRGLKTQNVEEFSIDMIFHNNFW